VGKCSHIPPLVQGQALWDAEHFSAKNNRSYLAPSSLWLLMPCFGIARCLTSCQNDLK